MPLRCKYISLRTVCQHKGTTTLHNCRHIINTKRESSVSLLIFVFVTIRAPTDTFLHIRCLHDPSGSNIFFAKNIWYFYFPFVAHCFVLSAAVSSAKMRSSRAARRAQLPNSNSKSNKPTRFNSCPSSRK